MLYERIDVFRKTADSNEIIIYRCWRVLSKHVFIVQSADRVRLPATPDELASHETRVLELFSEVAPNERSEEFPSLEAAILAFDLEFDNS